LLALAEASIKSSSELRLPLIREALLAYRSDFDEYSKVRNTLEIKAQSIIAVAGIFIAAVFPFIRDISKYQLSPLNLLIVKSLLVIAICQLGISIILAIMVLKVTKLVGPLSGDFVFKRASALLAIEDDTVLDERTPALLREYIAAWQAINEVIYRSNNKKSKWLWLGQLFMVISIGVVATISIIIVMTVKV
jgi:hypothetical protein